MFPWHLVRFHSNSLHFYLQHHSGFFPVTLELLFCYKNTINAQHMVWWQFIIFLCSVGFASASLYSSKCSGLTSRNELQRQWKTPLENRFILFSPTLPGADELSGVSKTLLLCCLIPPHYFLFFYYCLYCLVQCILFSIYFILI